MRPCRDPSLVEDIAKEARREGKLDAAAGKPYRNPYAPGTTEARSYAYGHRLETRRKKAPQGSAAVG
jgi:hypothetical protein